MPGMVVQARDRKDEAAAARRLHRDEEARQCGDPQPRSSGACARSPASALKGMAAAGFDYVLIGRGRALEPPFLRTSKRPQFRLEAAAPHLT